MGSLRSLLRDRDETKRLLGFIPCSECRSHNTEVTYYNVDHVSKQPVTVKVFCKMCGVCKFYEVPYESE
jgi:hypothetical protein